MSRQSKQSKKLALAKELSRVRKGGGKTGRTPAKKASRKTPADRIAARVAVLVKAREARGGLPW